MTQNYMVSCLIQKSIDFVSNADMIFAPLYLLMLHCEPLFKNFRQAVFVSLLSS